MTDSEQLVSLLRQALEDIEHTDIKLNGLSPEYAALGEAVLNILKKMQEVVCFTEEMADGNLNVHIPDRHNTLAGPIKDLYYKFMHLKWQANQIANGDYTQHVDFMGDFADAFNSMTYGLKTREEIIRRHTEETLRMTEKEKKRLERQVYQQQAHLMAYRKYTMSFQRFRLKYKEMLGRVYLLFSEQKFEEGRQLIAGINDMMGSDVSIRMDYSNNDYFNIALMEIDAFCSQNNIEYSAMVYIPEGYIYTILSSALMNHWMDLIFSLLLCSSMPNRNLSIQSIEKNGWLSFILKYYYAAGEPYDKDDADFSGTLKLVMEETEKTGALIDVQHHPDLNTLLIVIHIAK